MPTNTLQFCGSLGVVIPRAKGKRKAAGPAPAATKPQSAPAPAAAAAPKPAARMSYRAMTEAGAGASKASKPTASMWSLCEAMRGSRRRDVIAAAVAQGISFNTARTQYQLWLTASRAKGKSTS